MSECDDLRDCWAGCKLCGALPNPDGRTITCAPGCPQIYSYGQSPEERERWVEDAKAYRAQLTDIRENGT